ncbi:metal-dependent phosphohydrolase [Sphaerisporangium album]|uniref:Metal-dependent phosphohydrolase n=1 Tax=Sphaerisporangium album TaxID=509200 RepID=A0A367F156_9ACTN|nr:metal-dependent phosphohydrolase [Sphaerisporangium album]RCG24063.1 metal-dependent phosphohydrolase [Sphaerisporangium album]
MRDLAAAWRDVAGDSPAAGAVGAELVARWSEPHRRYHDLDHLRAVLAAIEPLAFLARDPAAVRLAAWFHDAVYEGRPGWDEERSAQLAQSRLARLLPIPDEPRRGRAGGLEEEGGRVNAVVRLVRLTAGHDPAPGDRDGEVLCDADLAVLAGPGYDAYARAVREEYRHVPDEAFRAGRARVLESLLAMPVLYRTEPARDLWESAARRNVRTELAALTTPPVRHWPRPR